MTETPLIQPRDVVWYCADKRRHAVVLRVIHERSLALVAWGTKTAREGPGYFHVRVDPQSRAGFVLGLEVPTFFYKRNVTPVPIAKLKTRPNRCPIDLFHDLRELAGFGG